MSSLFSILFLFLSPWLAYEKFGLRLWHECLTLPVIFMKERHLAFWGQWEAAPSVYHEHPKDSLLGVSPRRQTLACGCVQVRKSTVSGSRKKTTTERAP